MRPKENATLPLPREGRLPRLIAWAMSVLLILGAAGSVVADRVIRRLYKPYFDEARDDVIGNLDFFCEQQELLARDPWFQERRTEGDAGPLLNAWLRPQERSPLAIPSHLPQHFDRTRDWLTSADDVSTLDFGWMRELHAYDRWDVLRSAGSPPPERINMSVVRPPPGFTSRLVLWAQFRMLHGLRTGQPVEAARDVRQLAWLAYRTDLVLGGAVAFTLLRLEREAHASVPSPLPEWQPMSDAQLKRMHAVLVTGGTFSSLIAPAEVARRARRCGAVGRCIALGESAQVMKFLKPRVEARLRKSYAALAEDLEAFDCPTSVPRLFWERGMSVEEAGFGDGMPWDEPERFVLLPGPTVLPSHRELPWWFRPIYRYLPGAFLERYEWMEMAGFSARSIEPLEVLPR